MAGHLLPKGPMSYVFTTWTFFHSEGQHRGDVTETERETETETETEKERQRVGQNSK
jgi:hypothetical protein